MTTAPTDHDESTTMNVDRCVCFNVTFAQLHRFAESRECDEAALRREFQCGRGCGLCIPYIREMLETGRTVFPVNPPVADASSL